MKIGIFGDSYGHEPPDAACTGWPTILASKGYDITNFCYSGSSFYYSYKNYKKNSYKFDKNIFLVTQPSRLYIDNLIEECFKHVSPTVLKDYIAAVSRANDILSLKILKAVDLYYQYIHDHEYACDAQYAMLSKIKSHNTIFIPCFNDSIEETTVSLINWFEKENQYLRLAEIYINKREYLGEIRGDMKLMDFRACHLTQENNLVLADLIDTAIKEDATEINLSLDQVVKPHKDIKHYIRWEPLCKY